jgi:peroxiredoxin
MARTPSTMRELGSPLPPFQLPDATTGASVSSESMLGQVTVVAFICNHCPYVKHLKPELADFGRECEQKGVKMLAISSNDVTTHPDDSPELMKADAEAFAYPFPYLYDESQAVARAFDAACTPDFFVFDTGGKLAYRGQFDDSRPGNGKPIDGRDLRAAVDALIAGQRPSPEQRPSIGCNIKWRQ